MRQKRHRTPIVRILAGLCLLFGVVSPAHRAAAGPFIKINSIDSSNFPAVKVHLTATDGAVGHLSDLDDEHLSLIEDGYRINYMTMLDREASRDLIYLVFSLDTSKSIHAKNFAKLKTIARDIVNASTDRDRIAVYKFNSEVALLSNFTGNRADLSKLIGRLEAHGKKTLLYNSLYDSLDLLSRANGPRKAVIVFTDGRDEGSSVSAGDVIKFARDLQIPISFVAVDGDRYVRELSRIAKLTGGRLYRARQVTDVGEIYRTLVRAIKNQYVVQYKSMLPADGRAHTLEVRLKYGTLRDRDTAPFTVKKRLFDIAMPTALEIALAILIALLVLGMIVFMVIFLRRNGLVPARKTERAAAPRAESSEAGDYHVAIDLDEQERKSGDRVITATDPEYVYAKAWLLEKDGPEVGKKFPIFWDEVTLGRGDDNAIVIKDDAVSLNHAKIKRVKNAYTLYDLVSDNGTFLNDNKLLRPKTLYDWDEIRIGRTVLLFRGSKNA
ncbi:MAG TPA: VWA domain-containing protein [Spirochaetota bacterium]|nr:VWA domain-containing protein [Spirochaetota bacterium]HOS41431.1 VWA domain-containing protein [Spirochaetota bacterium]HPU87047.1 VWA domain-containing protein [Spirochaetota bacterium]